MNSLYSLNNMVINNLFTKKEVYTFYIKTLWNCIYSGITQLIKFNLIVCSFALIK